MERESLPAAAESPSRPDRSRARVRPRGGPLDSSASATVTWLSWESRGNVRKCESQVPRQGLQTRRQAVRGTLLAASLRPLEAPERTHGRGEGKLDRGAESAAGQRACEVLAADSLIASEAPATQREEPPLSGTSMECSCGYSNAPGGAFGDVRPKRGEHRGGELRSHISTPARTHHRAIIAT